MGGPPLASSEHPPAMSVRVRSRTTPRAMSSTISLVLDRPTAGPDVAALCDRVRALFEQRPADLVICDLGALTNADIGTIDALARLELTSRRLGCQMGVRNAPASLRDLLTLAGLWQVVGLGVEAGGQAEEREEALGVEEEGDSADPTA